MIIEDLEALYTYLAFIQSQGETNLHCELTPALSARMNDACLAEALVIGLPMVQGMQYRIRRSRGREVTLTAKLRYRTGVRILTGAALTAEESAALEMARSIAGEAVRLEGEEARFDYVYDWVCHNICYNHTAPGKKEYELLVDAAGAIKNGQANCQGFADVLYLLCGLCGIECEYRCGHGERRLHVWNVVRLKGEWREVDASRGARGLCD